MSEHVNAEITDSWEGCTPDGKPPVAGALYRVRHRRKGTFVARCVSADSSIWARMRIVAGRAGAMLKYNERAEGDEIKVRSSLCSMERLGDVNEPSTESCGGENPYRPVKVDGQWRVRGPGVDRPVLSKEQGWLMATQLSYIYRLGVMSKYPSGEVEALVKHAMTLARNYLSDPDGGKPTQDENEEAARGVAVALTRINAPTPGDPLVPESCGGEAEIGRAERANGLLVECWRLMRYHRLSRGELDERVLEYLNSKGIDPERGVCEGCGRPATHADSEGVPLCKPCWDSLLEDHEPSPTPSPESCGGEAEPIPNSLALAVEAAYREGFEDGRDNHDLAYEYLGVDEAWSQSKAKQALSRLNAQRGGG